MEPLADTHFHFTDPPFRDTPERVMNRCRKAGIDTVLVPGFSLEAAQIQDTLRVQYPDLPMAVGIHPLFHPKDLDLSDFLTKFTETLQPVAIGEIGLDYRNNARARDVQIALFQDQLAFAAQRELPVIIHCVRAHEDCLNILTTCVHNTADILPGRRGVIHRASCSVDIARKYANLGFFFSLGPDIFDHRRKRLRDLARWIPDDRLLLETDAPYAKNRNGHTAGPWDLADVAETLATLRNTTVDVLRQHTRGNTSLVFGI